MDIVKDNAQEHSKEWYEELERLIPLMMKARWIGHRLFSRDLQGRNLTVPQFVVLGHLSLVRGEVGPAFMTEISEATFQDAATMTGIIDRLVNMGLVKRERCPQDRRRVTVEVTQRGRELVQAVRQSEMTWHRHMFSDITVEDLRHLGDILEKMAETMARRIREEIGSDALDNLVDFSIIE